ncbi:MAG: phosphoglucosamine mutase [Candidatus Competibacteraceae bacterium]
MEKRYFGTDGIRGKVGEHPITAEFMLKLGWAAGKALASKSCNKVLIGKDTRISGYMFESALEAGLSAAGLNIALLGPMPTPGIAYLTRTLHACAGIVISASHNPYFDNGIKFFSSAGTKLPDELEYKIESMLEVPLETVEAGQLGKAERLVDAAGRYIEFCKSTIASNISLSGLKLVVDCANGATYHIAPNVFAELGATVIPLGATPDGLNINLDCGSTKPAALQAAVKAHQADLGIAFDGDGDRVMMVDHQGELVDGDELLFIIARERLQTGKPLGNAVVGTLMSNLGLELALRELGLDLYRTKVGDRYVMERLLADKLLLGGENSGHIICLDKTTTGDGIVSALQVLAVMVATGESLHTLKSGMQKFPQLMINVPLPCKIELEHSPSVQAAVRSAEAQLGRLGRVLLRPSGTEPVVRVMVEGDDLAKVNRLVQGIADIVKMAVAA